ncbi:MAG: molybdopterin-dependent oxidoreductase [Desulfitobacteriaceae bacterium]|nr:molybdopterin-dependent oxidoreductase [Desulfitobacteriaceae bacterium]MDI6878525.1 molybdopterin-dependent oxidoreductase [Desulfitobacteriaceae bacterium]MDI6914655.1 molybdopterin-dependent oxidoreductase [Desulfitobacteriaceae bacterium]
MKRRDFLKGALYGTGGTMIALGGFGTLTKLDPKKAAAAEQDALSTVFSTCEMCTSRCTVALKVKNGKVVKAEGHPNDTSTGGSICARGNAAPSLLYDPERIKKPMLRTGERGDGKFKEVSWDEAYSYITEKLKNVQKQYGGEALAVTSRVNPNDIFFRSLARAMGSPNMFSHEATCPMTRTVALEATFGNPYIGADYGNAKYIITNGRNFFEGIHVPMVKGVMKSISNGGKLVVLDPRFSVTAAKGEWVPIKGATDLAFIMAMANVMISENLYDKEFIAQYSVGFDKWVEAVKDKTPAWAEKETGIPKDKIVQITRDFAKAKPNCLLEYGWRTPWTGNDYQLRRAIMIVNMMMGNWEVPGGYFRKKGAALLKPYPELQQYAKSLGGGMVQPAFPKPVKGRIDGTGVKGTPGQVIPVPDGAVGQIPESILTGKPYPIKAWMVYRFNPVISMPESERVIEAIKKLDLMVTCDVYMTDAAYYSDVVLPECTYMERYDPMIDNTGLTPKFQIRQPAVSVVYPDTKPAWQIFKELGEKMGYGQYFPFKDMEEYLTKQLAAAGLTLAEMKEKGFWVPPGMKPFFMRGKDPKAPAPTATADQKIQIFSEELEEATKQGIPEYKHYPQPENGKFRFIQGKVAVHTNAGTHNVPVLNELMPTNTLWINSVSAGKLGIKEGDSIIISAGKYEHKGIAKVTEGIRPDSVFTYHGFGRISPKMTRAYGKGINDNKLIPNELGEIGNVVSSTTFVTVRKA